MRNRKFLSYIIAFLIIISLNFFLPRMMPGTPLEAIYGEEALVSMTPELKSQLTERFGLDKPLHEQFFIYVFSLIKGDLGYSYYYETPVLQLLLDSLPWTLLLAGSGLIISTALGFLIGLEAGWNRGTRKDKGILAGLMFINGFPDFFVGILFLLLFGVYAGLFPLSGALTPYSGLTGLGLAKDIIWHLTLPLISLVLAEISACFLLTRTTVVSILGEPYILTAKAKGLRDKKIKYRYVGRNSLLPIITRTGIRIGRLITGALFIEIVFSYPGIGTLIYNSLLTRDYAVLQGTFLLVAAGVLAVNFIIDLLYKKIDPRVV